MKKPQNQPESAQEYYGKRVVLPYGYCEQVLAEGAAILKYSCSGVLGGDGSVVKEKCIECEAYKFYRK